MHDMPVMCGTHSCDDLQGVAFGAVAQVAVLPVTEMHGKFITCRLFGRDCRAAATRTALDPAMLATVSVDWQHMQLDKRSAVGKGTAERNEVDASDNGDSACGSTPAPSHRMARTWARAPGVFADMDGIELGLCRAGHQSVLLNEIEPHVQAVPQAQFPDIELTGFLDRLMTMERRPAAVSGY